VRGLLTAVVLCLATAAGAEGVERSPRPPANPALVAPVASAVAPPVAPVPKVTPAAAPPTDVEAAPRDSAAVVRSLRPRPRPAALTERLAQLKAGAAEAGLDLASAPAAEPEIAAAPPLTRKEKRKKKRESASMEGAVCGIPAIKGEPIAPIGSNVGGCGVAEPVRVTSVAGVRLSQAATVDCSIAKALNSWVDEVAQPAFKGNLVELQVAAHYICRGRNNVKGAKISEHGKGRAIDISAFILSDGTVLTVKQNYNKLLRAIYKAGCGYFKTTLGPGSDGYHEDHFHFDTSARKGGAYCR
jgi:hypothetical protein